MCLPYILWIIALVGQLLTIFIEQQTRQLTFCVPDLQLDVQVTKLDRFDLEVDADGRDVRFEERVVDVSAEKIVSIP